MDLLMNGLLTTATLFAGGYCWVLARRVRELKSLDSGLGGAIVTLTRQVELARTTLEEARTASRDTRHDLAQLVARAAGAAGQLRMLIAAAPMPQPAPQPMPRRAPLDPAPSASTPEPAPEPEPAPVVSIRPVPPADGRAPHLSEVPKPRALAPVENPLRRREPAPAAATSEEDILEALTALAGGR
jgi:hypothetical protein